MTPKIFINKLDDAKIVAAIDQAEKQTSGEIRVYISTDEVTDPLVAAQQHFTRMGMEKTAQRNAVLFYIAPKCQRFAIVGDSGVHAKCGQDFWNATAEQMRALLKQDRYTEALITGIQNITAILAKHFPCPPDDRNELPNQIEGN
jgi:uncharacterized membrane protein